MKRLVAAISLVTSSNRLLYQHGYHAGSLADVVKHSVLIQLLQELQNKDTPYVYVETHAGAGAYRLSKDEHAEHQFGYSKLLETSVILPQATQTLVDLVHKASPPDTSEVVYPGSPLIASLLSRKDDSMLLCEKQSDQLVQLQECLPQAQLLHQDGYQALNDYQNLASSQRALVFIDPPYQFGSDSDQIVRLVGFLQRHWRSARLAIWYPASSDNRIRSERLVQRVRDQVDSDLVVAELYDDTRVGTGMILVNPPYGVQNTLENMLETLQRVLCPGGAQVRVETV